MYSVNQLAISGCKRQWILMDTETSMPLLYPLRYHIDHLAFRSLSTQSASLQSVKFFYEFWKQKYGVSFCYSFYSSGHNPDIAVSEMPSFWLYLENGQNVQSNVLSLTRTTKASSLTHAARVRAVIHFLSFLINTYISPAYRDDTPKALTLLASRLHIRLQLCRDNYRTLTPNKFSLRSHNSQGFQSLSGAMVHSLYGIIAPSSAQKHNPLNPFPSGHLQFRNFLIIRLLLNYGLRIGELLLLECSSIKPNSSVSSPGDPNTANYKGRCVSLQKLVNHFTFTLVKLQYNSDVKYTNKTNLTPKAREAMKLKRQERLEDSTPNDKAPLITIRGFLNIVSLIQRVETDSEKIALNCLLLLIVTGFRSVEVFYLRHVNGSLSTLSNPVRKRLIEVYVDQQLHPLNLQPKEKQLYVNRKTRQALLDKNKQLHAEIEVLRTQLIQNTFSVIEIVKAVKINTVIPVEHFLAPHLIMELHDQKKINEFYSYVLMQKKLC